MSPEASAIDGDQSVEQLRRELAEAREQQTATADVLKVIGRSTFNIQTVLDTLVGSAARLCHADKANITRVNGERLDVVAFSGFQDDYKDFMKAHSVRIDRGSISARSVIEARIIHVHDVLADPEFTMFEAQIRGGFRTGLAVPLLRERTPIGAFFLTRPTVDPFTQQQIDLVQTFADQAVIAIENTRLFEAEQTRTRELTERTQELTETLDYQTATSDVLNVISRSPSNLQPVLDAIVTTAVRLCQAEFADFRLLRDGLYGIAATTEDEAVHLTRHNPIAPGRGSVVGRAALERRTVHVPDVEVDPEYTYVRRSAKGTLLGVPLVRDGIAVGVIVLVNRTVRPFTQKQIALVTTFADQALIAIENTRLFEEVQARTRELTEALNQQTATGEILGVISRSPTDVRPVFEAI